MQAEAASADAEATTSYPEHLAKIMKLASLNSSFQCRQNSLTVEENTIIARGGESMPGNKALKDRLILLLGLVEQLKPMHFHLSENLRGIKNLQYSTNETIKPEWQHICLQYGLLNSLSPLLGPTDQKQDFFQDVIAH